MIEPDEGVVEKRENEWYESIQRFNSFNVKGFDGVVRYQTTDDENLMINNNKFNKQKQTKEVPSKKSLKHFCLKIKFVFLIPSLTRFKNIL